METVLCSGHNRPCYLKTGIKEGPNQGKSFYICSVAGSDHCSFSQRAADLKPMICECHGNTIELQLIHVGSTGAKRHYYRCQTAKEEKISWCGHSVLSKQDDKLTERKQSSVEQKSKDEGMKSNDGQSTNASLNSDQAKATNDRVKHFPLEIKSSSGQSIRIVDSSTNKVSAIKQNGLDVKNKNQWRKSVSAAISDSDSDDDCVITGFEEKEVLSDKTNYESVVSDTKPESKTSPPLAKQSLESPSSSDLGKSCEVKSDSLSAKNSEERSSTVESKMTNLKISNSGEKQPSSLNPKSLSIQSQSQVRTLSASDIQKNALRREELKKKLATQQMVMKNVKLETLPDRGHRITSQIKQLTDEIAALDVKINQDRKLMEMVKQAGGSSDGQKKVIVLKKPSNSASNLPGVKQPTQNLQMNKAISTGQLLPAGVKQTTITDHMPKLPAHVLQQMYAANPQAMTLYGGRMTAARLREVGSVTNEALERLHKQLETCPAADAELADPDGLEVPLMTHQRQALAWMTWRESQHPPGGILADDMGLGKTLTMISLVALKKQKEASQGKDKSGWTSKDKQVKQMEKGLVKSRATLVICPASLVHQWYKEVEKRCESGLLKVLMYHGPNRESDINRIANNDIVLTTYNLIGREVGVPEEMKNNKHIQDMPAEDEQGVENAENQPALLRIVWQRIILDEAHNIKNHKSLTAMSTCRLRAASRWALTGTPIQNDLLDMYSLLRFLRCSPFDEYMVWKRQVANHSGKQQQRLNTLVRSLLKRRTKTDTDIEGKPLVALPDKNFHSHEIELSKDERRIYDRIFQQSQDVFKTYLQRHEEKQMMKEQGIKPNSNPWSKEDKMPSNQPSDIAKPLPQDESNKAPLLKPMNPGGGQILLMLLRLRQCCSHLSLMRDAIDPDVLQADGIELDLIEQMQQLAVKENDEMEEPSATKTSYFTTEATSTKLKAVVEQVKEIRAKSQREKPMKCVIVSQWTKMLDVVQYHLVAEGFKCENIRGDIPAKKRAEIVEEFNNNPRGPTVMLVSLRAGGVGLNLIGGNHLFVMDMHWNPALEAQACDRIYRVGQKRDVFIHKFVCKDTVEERILKLQNDKLQLAKNILSGGGATANKLSLADLKLLFGVDTGTAYQNSSVPHF